MIKTVLFILSFVGVGLLGITAMFGVVVCSERYHPVFGTEVQAKSFDYSKLERLLTSEDAKYYYPTIKRAYKDSIITNGEMDEIRDIEENLDLLRNKHSFNNFWNSKERERLDRLYG